MTDEYDDCQHCGRTGLEHTVVLDDGSHVGTGCMKKVCGYSIPLKAIAWQPEFEPIAEHKEGGSTFVLWKSKKGGQTRTTQEGILTAVGGQTDEWVKRGWKTA